jgi:apolipoprotein N-acyltransferase
VTDRGRRALPLALAVAAGAALFVAHPPVGWWWTTFLGPGLLIAALQQRPEWTGRLGAVAGVIAFGPLLTWLLLPAGVLAWGLLVALQAAFVALFAVAVRPWLASRWLPLIAAVLWTGVDAIRATWPLGGFEWGAIAYAHVDGSWVLPVARVLGGRGITLLVVLVSVAGLETARRGARAVADRGDAPVDQALRTTNLPVALLVGGLLATVLVTIEPPPQVATLDVLAVQGNDIRAGDLATDPSFRISTQMRDATLAAIGDGPAPDLTVWPEASVDTDPYSERGARFLPLLQEAAAASQFLLAGVNLDGPDAATGFYRSQILLDASGQLVDRYDKRAVVPFGEYIPFRRYLDWFPPLDQIPRDILRAPAAQVIDAGDVAVAVLVCFETLFADVLRDNILAGSEPAGLVVAATTDASFGDSAEPAQHLAQSQLRAVETGRHVVHAALSGSSAFVAPDGEVTQGTELFEVATIRDQVPVVEGRTPFLVTGDLIGTAGRWVAVVALGWALWWRRWRPAKTRQGSS